MSEVVDTRKTKAAAGSVSVQPLDQRGLITLRGDLSDAALQSVCTDLTGLTFPAMGRIEVGGDTGLAWMSPDEVLIILPQPLVAAGLAQIAGALSGQHHLAVSGSDARMMIAVSGPGAREVLGKLTPIDLHPDAFCPGQFRRTHLGQIAAAVWMQDTESFCVICFRSVAEYTFGLIVHAARNGPVGHY